MSIYKLVLMAAAHTTVYRSLSMCTCLSLVANSSPSHAIAWAASWASHLLYRHHHRLSWGHLRQCIPARNSSHLGNTMFLLHYIAFHFIFDSIFFIFIDDDYSAIFHRVDSISINWCHCLARMHYIWYLLHCYTSIRFIVTLFAL